MPTGNSSITDVTHELILTGKVSDAQAQHQRDKVCIWSYDISGRILINMEKKFTDIIEFIIDVK